MLKFLLACALLWQSAWTIPVQLQDEAAGSPILILTPQAQVRLEPIPASYIHHLSPYARMVAPHEETIIYVPTSAGAPVLPVDAINVARSSGGGGVELQQPLIAGSSKQFSNISQQIEQIQAAIQTGISMYPGFSEAATAAASAASAAAATGAGLFPAFFPPSRDQASSPSSPTAAPTVLSAEARHLYVLPAGQIVDFLNGPHIVVPLSAVRARSIQQPELPIVAVPLPAAKKPEALPLQSADALDTKAELKQTLAEGEQQPELIKLLATNAQQREEQQAEQLFDKTDLKPIFNAKPLADNAPLAAADLAAATPLKSQDTVGLEPLQAAAPIAGNELPLRKS